MLNGNFLVIQTIFQVNATTHELSGLSYSCLDVEVKTCQTGLAWISLDENENMSYLTEIPDTATKSLIHVSVEILNTMKVHILCSLR